MTQTELRPSQPTQDRIAIPLLVTLALLSAVAPVATDLYLPSFPSMRDDLGTTASGVQLTLTAFMVGAGLGQLVFGPLSDRFGRRGPLLVGVVVYVAASVAAALAPRVAVLVAARLLQGLSGSAGMVIARAIVVDTVSGAAAARAMSLMMLVMGVAPVVAPVAGGLLADPIGWRGVLWVVAAIGVVSLALTLLFVRESHPAERRTRGGATPAHRIFTRRYVGLALTYAFGCSTMMGYIAASPFVYQTMMGLSELQYGLMFGLNAIGLSVCGAINARLVSRVGPERLLRTGLTLNLVAVVGVAVVAFSGVPAGWLAPFLLLVVASLGLVMGNASALALGAVPGRGGTASAWLGCTQFVLAGVVTATVGVAGEDTAVPLACTMLVGSLVAWAALTVATRRP